MNRCEEGESGGIWGESLEGSIDLAASCAGEEEFGSRGLFGR